MGSQSQTRMRTSIGWLEVWLWGLEERPGLEVRSLVEIISFLPVTEAMRKDETTQSLFKLRKEKAEIQMGRAEGSGPGSESYPGWEYTPSWTYFGSEMLSMLSLLETFLRYGARPVTLPGLVRGWRSGLWYPCSHAFHAVVDPCYQLASTLQKYWVITICSPCYPQNSNAPTTFFKLSCLLDFVMHTNVSLWNLPGKVFCQT